MLEEERVYKYPSKKYTLCSLIEISWSLGLLFVGPYSRTSSAFSFQPVSYTHLTLPTIYSV